MFCEWLVVVSERSVASPTVVKINWQRVCFRTARSIWLACFLLWFDWLIGCVIGLLFFAFFAVFFVFLFFLLFFVCFCFCFFPSLFFSNVFFAALLLFFSLV